MMGKKIRLKNNLHNFFCFIGVSVMMILNLSIEGKLSPTTHIQTFQIIILKRKEFRPIDYCLPYRSQTNHQPVSSTKRKLTEKKSSSKKWIDDDDGCSQLWKKLIIDPMIDSITAANQQKVMNEFRMKSISNAKKIEIDFRLKTENKTKLCLKWILKNWNSREIFILCKKFFCQTWKHPTNKQQKKSINTKKNRWCCWWWWLQNNKTKTKKEINRNHQMKVTSKHIINIDKNDDIPHADLMWCVGCFLVTKFLFFKDSVEHRKNLVPVFYCCNFFLFFVFLLLKQWWFGCLIFEKMKEEFLSFLAWFSLLL